MERQRSQSRNLERALLAASVAAATALEPFASRADEIDDLVAAGRSIEALPIALRDARAAPTDAAGWRRVVQISLWNSRDVEALEGLRALVRAEPGEARWRFEFARRLLWRHAYAEAEPHARWLADQATDDAPLEVAYWVLRGVEDRARALAVARRRVVATSGAPRARWALADLTHWSPDWREARAQYASLVAAPSEAPRARERADTLRRDHPDEVIAEGTGWCDSVGVQHLSAAVAGGIQLPSRLVLRVRGEIGRWSQGAACSVIAGSPAGVLPGQPSSLAVGSVLATLRFEATSTVQPELTGGFEADGSGNLAPVMSAGLRLSIAGRVFGRVWVQHDRYRASLASAHGDVRALGPAFTMYAEPTRWLFVAAEGSLWWLDDDNLRGRGLLAVGAHNVGALQVEPRAFAQVEQFDQQRPSAVPYFTPTEPLTVGVDMTLRYAPSPRLRAELGCGVALQGGQVSARPSLLLRIEPTRNLRLGVVGGYVGSPQYQQLRADLSVGWVF